MFANNRFWIAGLVLALPLTALARDHGSSVRVGVNIGGGSCLPPVVYAPAPVVVQTAPVAYQPAPVVYQSAPVVYQPAPVVVPAPQVIYQPAPPVIYQPAPVVYHYPVFRPVVVHSGWYGRPYYRHHGHHDAGLSINLGFVIR